MSTLEQVKALREKTGAGIVDVKKAFDEAGGDEAKAIELLRKRGQDRALKKSSREALEGIIVAYVHSNHKIGVLVKLLCETDFVGRNEEFRELGCDIAMHIAALSPQYIKPEDVPMEFVEKERAIWREQLIAEGKSRAMLDKIMLGKEEKFRCENALLTQAFAKDPSKTVGALIAEKIHKIGENIQVGSFVRYDM
ncbi:MAG TPA: translation elongation factor Ts [Patescibacteria group bacterium]|nr:translation elongation factor Ts [Patescibacteria group bacterium]